eukprot:3563512-Pleurochrysis_carterae.AAC.1
MDDKIIEREHELQMTTDRRVSHLLVSDPEAPSRIENFNSPSTPTGRIGALAVNGPCSGLVMADTPILMVLRNPSRTRNATEGVTTSS